MKRFLFAFILCLGLPYIFIKAERRSIGNEKKHKKSCGCKNNCSCNRKKR
jgi:hypothetical protein